MPTIRTPIAAVDAIQRVPVACWLGPFDNRNGFPNYPVWCDTNGTPVDTLDQATHALWDGAFSATTARTPTCSHKNMVAMATGDQRNVGPFAVTLLGVRDRQGPNYAALEAVLSVQRGEGTPFEMLPQLHQFTDPPMQTNQAAIRTMLDGQLYLVVGEPAEDGKWLIRMWWKPFVTFIWLGGAMIAFGGGLSLLGRVRRDIWHRRGPSAQAGRVAA